MKLKEIMEKLPISFEEEDLEREVSQEEYNQYVEQLYKDNLKYGRGKPINETLKQEYAKLKQRTKKVHNITNISFIKNAVLDRRSLSGYNNNFILVEDTSGLALVYNITTGEDNSFDVNNSIALDKNKTKIEILYDNKNESNSDLSLGYMQTIILYKNIELINNYNNEIICKNNLLEFTDYFNKKIYLDINNNHLYTRDNYSLITNNKTKQTLIFKKKEQLKFNGFKTILNHMI